MFRTLVLMVFLTLVLSLALPNVVQAIDSKSALLVWWPLDEGEGTVAVDQSGNGYDGPFVAEPLWVDGYTGSALKFDGVDDYAVYEWAPAESIEAFTVAFWVKAETLGQPQYCSPFTGHYPNTAGFQIDVDGGNPGVYRSNPNSGGGNQIPFGPCTTDWVYLVLTCDNRSMEYYYNGSHVGSGTFEEADIMWNEFAIGVNRNRNWWFNGIVDELRVYNRTLEAGQVQDLYNGILPDFSRAFSPSPVDGATAVAAALFTWAPGDGATFHDVYLGTSPELTESDRVATHQPFALYFHAPGLEPGLTYYWRVDEVEADMVTVHTGDVWSFTSQALTAYFPDPADGGVDVPAAPMLTWLPGQQATEHQVYFSDNIADVNAATAAADKGKVTDPNFAPGELASVTTYYWRVDEIVFDGTVRAGEVWSFTTVLPVEGFESYTDEEGSRIYETWIDGWTNDTGSTVGYVQAPFAEQTIVHGDSGQSMPLDYNNVNAPHYSEAERTFATPQDWTVDGIEVLIVSIQGRRSNDAESLYVAIEDSAGKAGVALNPDPEVAAVPEWTEWKIPLSEFAGVNLSRIKKITLGVGDRDNPTPGGAGLIYVDDIRLTIAAPVESDGAEAVE